MLCRGKVLTLTMVRDAWRAQRGNGQRREQIEDKKARVSEWQGDTYAVGMHDA